MFEGRFTMQLYRLRNSIALINNTLQAFLNLVQNHEQSNQENQRKEQYQREIVLLRYLSTTGCARITRWSSRRFFTLCLDVTDYGFDLVVT